MCPLRIEMYIPDKNKWITAGEVAPAGRFQINSAEKSEGEQVIYSLDCSKDDYSSTISKFKHKEGKKMATLRPIGDIFEAGEVIKTLRKGASYYEMDIKVIANAAPTKFRFTHK